MNKTTLESLEEALERLEQIDGMYSWAHLLYEVREALAEQELYEPEGRCKECLAYNGHLDYCSKSAPVKRPQNCGTGYCSCIECPYEAEQAEQEPLMDYERINALREGEQNGAEDAYFFVRPENDTPSLRKMFCQGFERGFHKGLKYASHVRTKDMTDDEIMDLVCDECVDMRWPSTPLFIARAVIAADRKKNK